MAPRFDAELGVGCLVVTQAPGLPRSAVSVERLAALKANAGHQNGASSQSMPRPPMGAVTSGTSATLAAPVALVSDVSEA